MLRHDQKLGGAWPDWRTDVDSKSSLRNKSGAQNVAVPCFAELLEVQHT